MEYFLIALGVLVYYFAVYYSLVKTIAIFQSAHPHLLLGFGLLMLSIPLMCVMDYLHRGNRFLEFMATMGYLLSGFVIYFVLIVLGLLMLKVFIRLIRKKKIELYTKKMIFGSAVGSFFICLVGVIGARVSLPKTLSFDLGLNQDLKIVAMSDIHYGSTGSIISLDEMVRKINQQEADIVILLGDVFDNHVSNLDHNEFAKCMNQIESKYGVYAVTGNHEFISNNLEEIIHFYEGTQVKLLLDEEVTILNEFRMVGRLDYRIANRKNLNEITTDNDLPLLVLDHQPQCYRDALEEDAFLQISGHTHNGQIFPANIFLYFFNRIKYQSPTIGIHHYNNFTLGITRGYGTWGFPLRLTGTSQYFIIELK